MHGYGIDVVGRWIEMNERKVRLDKVDNQGNDISIEHAFADKERGKIEEYGTYRKVGSTERF